MSQLLSLENFAPINILEETLLDADANASQAVIKAKDVTGFGDNAHVVIGAHGKEQTEIKTQSGAASGQNLTMASNLVYSHKRFERVTRLRGDKIRIYRAANSDGTAPADSAFSLLTTVTIEPDKLNLTYNDTSGGSDYWYKMTYYNSISTVETDVDSVEAFRGGEVNQFITIDQVRRASGFLDNPNILDSDIADARDDAESLVKGAVLAAGYTLPLDTPAPRSVRRMALQLASAYLLQQEYGTTSEGTSKDGYEKEERVMEQIQKVQDKKIILIDAYKDEIEAHGGSIGGWPDNTTKDDEEEDAGGRRIFTIKQKF